MVDSERAWKIVREVALVVATAAAKATEYLTNRDAVIRAADETIEPLLDEYFDILPIEKTLINDTVRVIVPSLRPTQKKKVVQTIYPSNPQQLTDYTERLCNTLNDWSKNPHFVVRGRTIASEKLGIGVAMLQKTLAADTEFQQSNDSGDLLASLARLRKVTSRKLSTFELFRGAKVFDRARLYLVKPIGQRFWTQTAALNDADEIFAEVIRQNRAQFV